MIPVDSIDAMDLKNRVYLAATLDIDKENLHIHSSLQETRYTFLQTTDMVNIVILLN